MLERSIQIKLNQEGQPKGKSKTPEQNPRSHFI